MISCQLCGSRIPTEMHEYRQTGDCQCSREKMARLITRFFYCGQALVRGGYIADEIEENNPVALELVDSVKSCICQHSR